MSNPSPAVRRRTHRPVSRAAVWTAAAAVLGGCYQYAPMLNPVAGGAPVQVTLTDAGSVAVASQVGPRIETIEGLCTSASPDSLVLSVTQTTASGGTDTFWKGERVVVPRSAVASFGVRRLSATRTALAATAGVGVLVAAVAGFSRGQTQQGGTVRPLPGGQ